MKTTKPKLPGNTRILSLSLAQALGRQQRISAAEWALDEEEMAYAVHDGLIDLFEWHHDPRKPQYWKSGGGSREARLTHAPLPPDRARHVSKAVDGMLDFSDLALNAPGAEAEIALRFGAPVHQWMADTLTPEEALDLVHSYAVSVELVSSRWEEGSAAPALLRLADLQSHGALALGDWKPFKRDLDWSAQACSMKVNDEAPLSAKGTHPLGDPAWGLVAWLQHATRHGDPLPAGSVVTTGAWIVRQGLKAGDRVTVTFDGIGSVSVKL